MPSRNYTLVKITKERLHLVEIPPKYWKITVEITKGARNSDGFLQEEEALHRRELALEKRHWN